MSDDKKKPESLDDFDFDSFNLDEPQQNPGESSFDLDDPFGGDIVATDDSTVGINGGMDTGDLDTGDLDTGDLSESAGASSFDLDDPFGGDMVITGSGMSTGDLPESTGASSFDLDDPFGGDMVATGGGTHTGDFLAGDLPKSADSFGLDDPYGGDLQAAAGGVSADNPYLSGAASATTDGEKKGKKGFLSGIFGGKGKKDKSKKATSGEEGDAEESESGITKKGKKEKKEKVVKEKKPAGERAPLEVGEILCIGFTALWLACMLLFNIVALLYYFQGEGISLLQTLAFMGAINVVGLAGASVPILFYRFPKERTLPNVMLGISAFAIFIAIQIAVTGFYRYGFALSS